MSLVQLACISIFSSYLVLGGKWIALPYEVSKFLLHLKIACETLRLSNNHRAQLLSSKAKLAWTVGTSPIAYMYRQARKLRAREGK